MTGGRSDINRALDEAGRALQANCPNATSVLCRKALELYTGVAGPKKSEWDERLQALHDRGRLDRRMFRVAHHVRRIGNKAAHTRRGTTPEEARDSWELTKIFFHDVGMPLESRWGPLASLSWTDDPLKKVPVRIPWRKPVSMSRTELFPAWQDGGLVDVLFRCLQCGTPVEVEFLEVPEPWMLADTSFESRRFNSEYQDCSRCGASYEATSDNSLMGWGIEILALSRGKRARTHDSTPEKSRIAPAKGSFRFRVVEDYGDSDVGGG